MWQTIDTRALVIQALREMVDNERLQNHIGPKKVDSINPAFFNHVNRVFKNMATKQKQKNPDFNEVLFYKQCE